MTKTQPAKYQDKNGNTVDRHWYASTLQTTMQFRLTLEQAGEILTLWRNREWQAKHKVKVFKSFYNDHGYHKCWSYELKDAEATNTAGISNYRRSYGIVFHWMDASNFGPHVDTYSVIFHDSYGEMIP